MDSTPAPISHHLLASDHRGSGGEREMERADSEVYFIAHGQLHIGTEMLMTMNSAHV